MEFIGSVPHPHDYAGTTDRAFRAGYVDGFAGVFDFDRVDGKRTRTIRAYVDGYAVGQTAAGLSPSPAQPIMPDAQTP